MTIISNDFPRMTREEQLRVWSELRQLYDEETARLWINTPNPLLGNSPCDCTFVEVSRLLSQMTTGAFV